MADVRHRDFGYPAHHGPILGPPRPLVGERLRRRRLQGCAELLRGGVQVNVKALADRNIKTGKAKVTAGTLAATVAAMLLAAPSASAAIPARYKNCTALNEVYPHGIGRIGARDRTSGDPVRTFKRSTRIYRLAMSYNGRLDGDKDGIACEKE